MLPRFSFTVTFSKSKFKNTTQEKKNQVYILVSAVYQYQREDNKKLKSQVSLYIGIENVALGLLGSRGTVTGKGQRAELLRTLQTDWLCPQNTLRLDVLGQGFLTPVLSFKDLFSNQQQQWLLL